MQEPVFLLVIMLMTALGVRVFLGQLHGTPLRLPRLRLRLPLPSLPQLPGRSRRKPARDRSRQDEYPEDDDEYEAGSFAPTRSPFIATAPAGGLERLREPVLEPVTIYEDEYQDEAYVPASQVDFFASQDDSGSASPLRRAYAEPEGEPDGSGLEPYTVVAGSEPPPPDASPVYQVAVEPEPDPNDIMSFFEKPASVTQLPETLLEDIQPVTAAALLAEARQLRALIHRDAA